MDANVVIDIPKFVTNMTDDCILNHMTHSFYGVVLNFNVPKSR